MLPTQDLFDPNHRFVDTSCLRAAYPTYERTRSPGAPNFVTLSDDLELGIVSTDHPAIARAISSLLTRSLEQARCELGGHLPTEVVRRVQRDIISPDKVGALWGSAGHRFVLARRVDAQTHEILATILVAASKDTIFFFTGRYDNQVYSRMKHAVDWDQADTDDPAHRWFDRFAFPPLARFKPNWFHHIANFVVSPDHRGARIAGSFLENIRRYYANDVLAASERPDPIHSQSLLCGIGFWQIGDPPWMERMKKLGFYRRWGAESFFVEHDWAPLPQTVMDGKVVDNLAYNRLFGMPDCYAPGQERHRHPSDEHLQERVAEVVRLAQNPRYKLQYYQAMFGFVSGVEGERS